MAAAEVAKSVENGVRFKLEQAYDAPAATKPTNSGLLKLHRDGVPFVFPSKRGIDPTAPEFDPEDFLNLLGEDVMFIQHEKLRQILELQADVEYLRRVGLNGSTDVGSFRKCVPVVSYSDLEADITRVVNGEKTPIFTVDPITSLNLRSADPPLLLSHLDMSCFLRHSSPIFDAISLLFMYAAQEQRLGNPNLFLRQRDHTKISCFFRNL